HPAGGFYSAEDADSLLAQGKPEHAEGAFYVWTRAEVDTVLGEDAAFVCDHFGIAAEGNVPLRLDPHNEFTGKNILMQRRPLAETARAHGLAPEVAVERLATALEKLRLARERRPRPHLDDKIITAWNGLMISAFARASQVFDDAEYLKAAQASAKFIRENLWKNGALIRNYRGGASDIAGFADDYAYLIQALLNLYEADFDVSHLKWAVEL